jgi:hypothetical protein
MASIMCRTRSRDEKRKINFISVNGQKKREKEGKRLPYLKHEDTLHRWNPFLDALESGQAERGKESEANRGTNQLKNEGEQDPVMECLRLLVKRKMK